MRRRNKEKKRKRNQVIIALIAVFLMVSSIGGFVVLNSPSQQSSRITRNYEGVRYEFKQLQDNAGNVFYEVSYDKRVFTTFYLPDQLYMDNSVENFLKEARFFYLTFNPNISDLSTVDYIRYDIQQNLPNDVFFQSGITEESNTYNLPIVDCDNATITQPVVKMQEGNTTSISMSNNCVILKSPPQDVLRVRDMLVYVFNGVTLG